jgi:L-serine dehydratase
VSAFVGVFDLFRIGIGPSSSHTVGPMRAAGRFLGGLRERGLDRVAEVRVDLFGSLAATGDGHGTPGAVLAGLSGEDPEFVDIPALRVELDRIAAEGSLRLGGEVAVPWSPDRLTRRPFTVLPRHPNALRFRALDADGTEIADETWYSVGGGFVHREGDPEPGEEPDEVVEPLPFGSADELLARCDETGLTVWEVMRRDEETWRSPEQIDEGIARIHRAMTECIEAGLGADGRLPGGLEVRRRAAEWHAALLAEDDPYDARFGTEWLNVVAIAVNEENAAGGRVVTAPTNGAAGIVPAVLAYALLYVPGLRDADEATRVDAVARYLLTAAAIGSLYKRRASISGAEVGCQGEVGSASSMAAAGITELLGGTPRQIENAAEIAMEHNLGLSCDPVGGLVQIPCIERNAIAAAKAVNAGTMAMRGNGEHRVSLDQAIETMRQTGRDMSDKYKETSRGGLAVNVIEC